MVRKVCTNPFYKKRIIFRISQFNRHLGDSRNCKYLIRLTIDRKKGHEVILVKKRYSRGFVCQSWSHQIYVGCYILLSILSIKGLHIQTLESNLYVFIKAIYSPFVLRYWSDTLFSMHVKERDINHDLMTGVPNRVNVCIFSSVKPDLI